MTTAIRSARSTCLLWVDSSGSTPQVGAATRRSHSICSSVARRDTVVGSCSKPWNAPAYWCSSTEHTRAQETGRVLQALVAQRVELGGHDVGVRESVQVVGAHGRGVHRHRFVVAARVAEVGAPHARRGRAVEQRCPDELHRCRGHPVVEHWRHEHLERDRGGAAVPRHQCHRGGEPGTGARAADTDARAIDGDRVGAGEPGQRGEGVVHRRGKGVLGREPVVDRHHDAPGAVRERQASAVLAVEVTGDEAATVEVHESRPRARVPSGFVDADGDARRAGRSGNDAVCDGDAVRDGTRAHRADDRTHARPHRGGVAALSTAPRQELCDGGQLAVHGAGLGRGVSRAPARLRSSARCSSTIAAGNRPSQGAARDAGWCARSSGTPRGRRAGRVSPTSWPSA